MKGKTGLLLQHSPMLQVFAERCHQRCRQLLVVLQDDDVEWWWWRQNKCTLGDLVSLARRRAQLGGFGREMRAQQKQLQGN